MDGNVVYATQQNLTHQVSDGADRQGPQYEDILKFMHFVRET